MSTSEQRREPDAGEEVGRGGTPGEGSPAPRQARDDEVVTQVGEDPGTLDADEPGAS